MPADEAVAALQALLAFARNVAASPSDARFRRINLGNVKVPSPRVIFMRTHDDCTTIARGTREAHCEPWAVPGARVAARGGARVDGGAGLGFG